jgi:hypothetical protein
VYKKDADKLSSGWPVETIYDKAREKLKPEKHLIKFLASVEDVFATCKVDNFDLFFKS